MRSPKLEDHKLLGDIRGSVLVESTIVIPLFLVLVLGTVDVTYMFYEWALANKAAYVGARVAVTSNAVFDAGMTSFPPPTQPSDVGRSCLTVGVNCASVSSICTDGTCSSGTFDNAAFTRIFNTMQNVFPALQRQNVAVSYATNGSGTYGQTWDGSPDPGNPQFTLPMNVTVSIGDTTRGATAARHQFYFISPLLRFFGGGIAAAPAIPNFATTLQSEDLFTN